MTASPIDNKIVTTVEEKIDRAYALAAKKDTKAAVELFGEVRSFGEHPSLKSKIDELESEFQMTVQSEMERFRNYVRQGNPVDAERRVVVLADSLGLPRPGQPLNVIENDATSYSFALREAVKRRNARDDGPKTAIDPICQRYATSNTVLTNMDLADLKGADLVIHVGLNDFSRRIFMERQRLAMKLLPKALTNKIVKFSQANMYRADLIRHYDEFCYVPHDQWEKNIAAVAQKARDAGVRSITWLTIIQLPLHVESHTPNYRLNVTRYNLSLYNARKNGRIHLLDVDRLFWEHGFTDHMHDDLMHLSPTGHLSVCNRLVEKMFNVAQYTVKEKVA